MADTSIKTKQNNMCSQRENDASHEGTRKRKKVLLGVCRVIRQLGDNASAIFIRLLGAIGGAALHQASVILRRNVRVITGNLKGRCGLQNDKGNSTTRPQPTRRRRGIGVHPSHHPVVDRACQCRHEGLRDTYTCGIPECRLPQRE